MAVICASSFSSVVAGGSCAFRYNLGSARMRSRTTPLALRQAW
jgi:hypothetical protein